MPLEALTGIEDPLTAAVCSPAEIREMALKLFRAQRRFLKGYR